MSQAGNPDQVPIMGPSAGRHSISRCVHSTELQSPRSLIAFTASLLGIT